MMKVKFTKTAFGIAFGLCAVAVPGYCTNLYPQLDFSNNGAPNGTITDTGTTPGTSYISAFTDYLGTLSVTGAASAANGMYNITGGSGLELLYSGNATSGTLSLILTAGASFSGTTFSNINSGNSVAQTLITWAVSGITFVSGGTATPGHYTDNGLNADPIIALGAATSLSTASTAYTTFVNTDLGATGSLLPEGDGGTIQASGSAIGTNEYSATSSTPDIVLTPEPVSFLMLGTGLLALAFFGRKRLIAK